MVRGVALTGARGAWLSLALAAARQALTDMGGGRRQRGVSSAVAPRTFSSKMRSSEWKKNFRAEERRSPTCTKKKKKKLMLCLFLGPRIFRGGSQVEG
jgi:hypothetical protein